MKAAIVRGPGQTPVYGDFAEPKREADENRIRVSAAALSPLARGRASGAHYSALHSFPFVAGVDGVGRLDDGRRAYFLMPRAPFGAMAEEAVVSSTQFLPLPDGLDDITAAAIANPAMSSCAALTERAKFKAGETVLVNGATGAAGQLAVQIAKRLGAAKVIATGRNLKALQEAAELGADATIPLVEDEAALDASFAAAFEEGVDVVIDYLWGKSAERLLIAAAKAAKAPVRFVQIGSISGETIALPSAVLRSAPITLMGSGLGSVPLDRLLAAIGPGLEAAASGGVRIAAKAVPLSEVEQAWTGDDSGQRVVFTVGAAQ
ncbi:MAG TPA: zinc-binding alcohol dehydrogenase family protein [Roseiarcus sp.]|jgi:NADPH:quinone reductase-like Zn-dependent oxidoreductase